MIFFESALTRRWLFFSLLKLVSRHGLLIHWHIPRLCSRLLIFLGCHRCSNFRQLFDHFATYKVFLLILHSSSVRCEFTRKNFPIVWHLNRNMLSFIFLDGFGHFWWSHFSCYRLAFNRILRCALGLCLFATFSFWTWLPTFFILLLFDLVWFEERLDWH